MTAERAPEAPARGLEWVVMWGGRTGTDLRASAHPPAHPGKPGPGRSLQALPVQEPCRTPPPGLYGRDLTSFTVKLVKTA